MSDQKTLFAQPQMSQATRSADTAGLLLLIADDNQDAAESLGMLLWIEGHAVHITHDGETALAIARQIRPDVLMLDIGLPGMDGNSVARRVRESLPDARMLMVAVTGRGSDEDKETTRAAGFDHHFTKPVDLNALRKSIARWSEDNGISFAPAPSVK